MRVVLRVAVAGKMFGGGNHARVKAALCPRRAEDSGVARVLAKGARSEYRGIFVAVQIDCGREVHVDAKRGDFFVDVVARIIRVVRIAARADGKVSGRDAGVPLYVADPAALLVCCHKERNFKRPPLRLFLHAFYRARHKRRVVRVPAKNFYASQAARRYPFVQKVAGLRARPPEHQYLRIQFFVAHPRDERVGQFFVGVVAPKVYVVLGEGGAGKERGEGQGRKG